MAPRARHIAQLKENPRCEVLQPLETGTIDITMDARRFTAAKTVTIQVTVGQPPNFNSTALLTVSANSRQDVVFNPGVVAFGVVPQGQAVTKDLQVDYAGKLEWRIVKVNAGNAPLDRLHSYGGRPPRAESCSA